MKTNPLFSTLFFLAISTSAQEHSLSQKLWNLFESKRPENCGGSIQVYGLDDCLKDEQCAVNVEGAQNSQILSIDETQLVKLALKSVNVSKGDNDLDLICENTPEFNLQASCRVIIKREIR